MKRGDKKRGWVMKGNLRSVIAGLPRGSAIRGLLLLNCVDSGSFNTGTMRMISAPGMIC